MLRFRKKDSKELIKRMAKTNGCSVSEIRREMQYAIDEARNSDDPDKKRHLYLMKDVKIYNLFLILKIISKLKVSLKKLIIKKMSCLMNTNED